jgi:TRAP-type mannitol/chloroaromatic compound transport system permease large subunit
MALFAYGTAARRLSIALLREIVHDTIVVTGALFALLIAATVFTLVLRACGTDRLVAAWVTGLGGGMAAPLAAALALIALCAFVLDAFEMIFVVIPVLVPPVLVRVPDAVWVAVLTLLILQASFLVPPFGYAVQMVRNALRTRVPLRAFTRALLPYLAVQLVVIAAVLAWPHALWRDASREVVREAAPISDEDAQEQMRRQLEPPPEE